MPSKLIAFIPLMWGASELVMLLLVAPGLAGAVALLAVHSAVCLCAGAGAVRLIGASAPSSLAVGLATALILGQGLLGALWQVLAATGRFTPALVIVVAVVCALPGLAPARALLRRTRDRAPVVARELAADGLGWRLLAALLVGLAAWSLVLAAHPPEGDALAFYISQPRLIADAGALVPLPGYEAFATVGLGSEMHFAVGFLFLGELAAKLMAWTCLLSLALALTGLAAQVGLGARGRLVVVAMLFSSSAALNVLYEGKVDLFGAALGLGSVLWVVEARAPGEVEGGRRALPVAGLLGGLAIGAKLSYAIVLPSLLGVVATWRLVQRAASAGEHARAVGRGALVGATAAVVGLVPIALKNWLVFGDPLALLEQGAMFNQAWFSLEDTRWLVATYPLALVLGKYPMQDGGVSPLLLAFAPLGLLWLRSHARTPLGVTTLAAALAIGVWVLLRPSIMAPRYIFPPLLVGLVFGASVAERLASDARSRALRGLVPWCVVVMLVLLVVGYRGVRREALRSQSGAHSRVEAVLGRKLAERLAPGERWMLASYYSYGIDSDLLQCAFMQADAEPAYAARDPVAVWAALHERGARALVLNRTTHDRRFAAPLDPRRTPSWLTIGETTLTDAITIFWLEPGPGAPMSRAYCEQARPGIWTVRER